MTPLYLDSQEAVDRHNERVKVQQDAGYSAIMAISPLAPPDLVQRTLDKLFPFAELRPSGFVGGSGAWYEWHHNTLIGRRAGSPSGDMLVPASDRAAASAALCSPEEWNDAICRVAERLPGCDHQMAASDYKREVITEAQAILDREGNK